MGLGDHPDLPAPAPAGVRVPRHQGPGLVVSTAELASAGQANSSMCSPALCAWPCCWPPRSFRTVSAPPEGAAARRVAGDRGGHAVSHFGQFHGRSGSAWRVTSPPASWPHGCQTRRQGGWRWTPASWPSWGLASPSRWRRCSPAATATPCAPTRSSWPWAAATCCPPFFHCAATSAALAKSLGEDGQAAARSCPAWSAPPWCCWCSWFWRRVFRTCSGACWPASSWSACAGPCARCGTSPACGGSAPPTRWSGWPRPPPACWSAPRLGLAGVPPFALSLAGRTPPAPRCPARPRAGAPASSGTRRSLEGLAPGAGRAGVPLHGAAPLRQQRLLPAGRCTASRGWTRAARSPGGRRGTPAGAGTGGPRGGRDPGSGSGAASLVPAAARLHAVVIGQPPLLFLDVAGLATLQELHRRLWGLGHQPAPGLLQPSVTDTLRRGGFLGEDQGDAAEDGAAVPQRAPAVQAAPRPPPRAGSRQLHPLAESQRPRPAPLRPCPATAPRDRRRPARRQARRCAPTVPGASLTLGILSRFGGP